MLKNRVPKTLPCGTYLLVNFHDNAAESITLSYKLTLSKKKKLKGNVAFIPTAILVYFASLTLIQHVCKLPFIRRISPEPKIAPLISRTLEVFGHPVYFDYQDFLGFASDLSFRSFNAEKL